MRILANEDIDRLKAVLEYMFKEIDALKDGTSHKSACGCKDCDHDALCYGLFQKIGED